MGCIINYLSFWCHIQWVNELRNGFRSILERFKYKLTFLVNPNRPFANSSANQKASQVNIRPKTYTKQTQVLQSYLHDPPTVHVGTQWKPQTATGARYSKHAHRDRDKGRKADEISPFENWVFSKYLYSNLKNVKI